LSRTRKSKAKTGFVLDETVAQSAGNSTAVAVKEPAPLASVHEDLLLALDRMLTTGTYYPPGHTQYAAVAKQCTSAIAAVLQDRPKLTIEVTAEGLLIGSSLAPKDDRCARRLYELLEPLNQALLEIHAGVTTEDIHEALSTLKLHHQKLSGTRNYQEIEIEGMPETITATGRSLYVRTRKGNGPEKTDSPINEYFDPNMIPDAALVPTPEGQMMEREFLGVIRGLMKSGDPTRLQTLMNADDRHASEVLGTWVPDFAIKTIKDILDALETTNSDPMMLQHLIVHAQKALQLTGDPTLVELVFEKLRKEHHTRPKSQKLLENRPKPSRKPVRFTMSRVELRHLIDEVYTTAEAQPWSDDIVSPANADCIGICLQILHVAPTEQLADGIASTLRQVFRSPDLSEMDLQVATDALISVFKSGESETADLIVTMVCTPLRHAHREKLGPLWLDVWDGLGTYQEKERAWPHAVNELLMGLTWENTREKLALYQELSKISVDDRVDLLVKLESLQALQEKILAKDLFHAPAPLLYGVHKLLMGSSMAERHGPLLHRRLAHQKAHPLATILVDGFGGYNHAHRKAYEAILDQGVAERVVPALKDIAIRHLKGTLNRLPEERREEAWVADAIMWLGRLGGETTRPIIEKILNEKKYLVFPIWPAGCREAARAALADESPGNERGRLDDDT